jgi:hypothetical protein
MGARGTLSVIDELQRGGFAPIELERYSTSNKIWSTKIKRLRLPDLLCVQTGLRVEVRAKASLEIRMSHAPNNQDRHWDAGLRPEDVIALVPCRDVDGMPEAAGAATYFGVDVLRASMDAKQLSKMKAASEGAEQYLTWPSVVSSRPGHVLECDSARLSVEWSGDGTPPRRYAYALRGKQSYVVAGESFAAYTVILAGTPAARADLAMYRSQRYQPLEALSSANIIDRYSAVKALAFRPDLREQARPAVERMVGREADGRLALEIAGTAASLGLQTGLDYIRALLWSDAERSMRMEAAFIATEVGVRTEKEQVTAILSEIAGNRKRFQGDEVRQAAVWGLGRAGLRRYDLLLDVLADEDEDVALHAIAGFGSDTSEPIAQRLVAGLADKALRTAAAASEALRIIGGPVVLRLLIEAARERHEGRPWVLATLGRLPAQFVRAALAGDGLLAEIEPLLLTSSGNWLSREDTATRLRFLLKQA